MCHVLIERKRKGGGGNNGAYRGKDAEEKREKVTGSIGRLEGGRYTGSYEKFVKIFGQKKYI